MTTDRSASQTWDPQSYMAHAAYVPAYGEEVLALLDPKEGERVLDLGCGEGVLTEKIAAVGAEVTGVDASAPQVDAARARGLDAHVMGGEALDFGETLKPGSFDAVFSNAALHWIPNAEAVVRGVARALKPGGRFVGEFGGDGNVATISDAILAALEKRGIDGHLYWPWFFPTADAYRALLQQHGFKIEACGLIPRPTPLPTGLDGWLDTFAVSFLDALPEDARAGFKDEVAEALAPKLRGADGAWQADYVRLRFWAVKERG